MKYLRMVRGILLNSDFYFVKILNHYDLCFALTYTFYSKEMWVWLIFLSINRPVMLYEKLHASQWRRIEDIIYYIHISQQGALDSKLQTHEFNTIANDTPKILQFLQHVYKNINYYFYI